MNLKKIALLFVICVQQHSSVAGTKQSRHVDDNKMISMSSTARAILNTQIILVPKDFSLCMTQRAFDNYIARIKGPHDDEDLLREYFSTARARRLLFTKCPIGYNVDTLKPVTLGELLSEVSDPALKRDLVMQVTSYISEQNALFASVPWVAFPIPVQFTLDVSQETIDLVCALSASKNVTTPAQQL
jgi:hypothetical protein